MICFILSYDYICNVILLLIFQYDSMFLLSLTMLYNIITSIFLVAYSHRAISGGRAILVSLVGWCGVLPRQLCSSTQFHASHGVKPGFAPANAWDFSRWRLATAWERSCVPAFTGAALMLMLAKQMRQMHPQMHSSKVFLKFRIAHAQWALFLCVQSANSRDSRDVCHHLARMFQRERHMECFHLGSFLQAMCRVMESNACIFGIGLRRYNKYVNHKL